jgi:ribonuclease P protein component
MSAPAPNQRFPKTLRLRDRGEFDRVYQQGISRRSGPLVMHALPNDLPHARLGLSTSRRVGNAVRRNRIRRLLREAYRLDRHQLPAGYDVVITVRPHEPLELSEYRRRVCTMLGELDDRWQARLRRRANSEDGPCDGGS